MTGTDRLRELTEAWTALQAQNEWLHARITELEAELAMLRGTVARQVEDDRPAVIHHDVPPNAPR